MTNAKTTKRALIMSVMSLLLCFTMLLGTTFAWFTDSVTSANNIITSGNLDVELYYQVEGQTDWTKVTETTNVFKENALWEPGHTEIVKLKVVNEGSLALKYQLGVNVAGETGSVNVNGDDFLLSEFIKFAVIDGANTYTRDEAIAAAEAKGATPLKTAYNSGVTALLADEEAIVTMVVYMPTTVGNDANAAKGAATPTINLGLNLFATQLANEEDSFGPDYDENAPFSMWDGKVPTEMPETLVVDGATQTIHVQDAAAFAYLSTLSAKWADFYTDGNGRTYTNYANGAGVNYYYSGQWTISLEADIDLGNHPIDPVEIVVGENCGYSAFNGNNHVIRNINTTTGMFADMTRTNYANLVLENVKAAKGALTGVSGSSITNVTVKNATISGVDYIGGLVGKVFGSVSGCKVIDSSVVGAKEVGGLIGYAETNSNEIVIANNTVKNVSAYANNRAAGLVAQPNVNIKVYGNTVDTVTVGAEDTSKYQPGAVVSNALAPENVYDNTVANATILGDLAIVEDAASLKEALDAGTEFINANGANLGKLSYGLNTTNVPAGKTVTISNAKFEGKSYGNAVAGTVIFENCTFTNTGAYSIHFDAGNGDVIFKNCTLEGWCSFGSTINSVTMENCTIQGNGKYGIVRFYQDTTLTNCRIDVSNVDATDVYHDGVSAVNCKLVMTGCDLVCCDYEVAEGGTIYVDRTQVVTSNDDLKAAVETGATKVMLAKGEYDLNGIQKDGLTLVGIGNNVKVANTTKYASGKSTGAIWKAINLENVTLTNTVYTMADGGKATFTNVYFAAGFRQGYGTGVVFTDCTFGSNSEGYALHFQTDSASEGGLIKLNGCKFEGGKVHLGGKRAYEFNGCDFAAGTDFQVWSNITLENCTVNGEKVTAENMATLFPRLDAAKVTIK